jgi:hypothetical protein
MSEGDATDLEHEALEAEEAEREAFEARFPPEAFTEVTKALKVRPTPEILSRLRGWLLPGFYDLYYFCKYGVKRPTRKEEIALLKKIHKAASTLHSAMTNVDINFCLPLGLLAPDEGGVGVTDNFVATLQLLANTAAGEIEKPASGQSRRGRPPKNEPFRQLTPTLVRLYESVRKEPAGRPYQLPDSRMYGSKGSFYPFALAVWHCLQDHLPAEARAAIPPKEGGLAEELKQHWPEDSVNR